MSQSERNNPETSASDGVTLSGFSCVYTPETRTISSHNKISALHYSQTSADTHYFYSFECVNDGNTIVIFDKLNEWSSPVQMKKKVNVNSKSLLYQAEYDALKTHFHVRKNKLL